MEVTREDVDRIHSRIDSVLAKLDTVSEALQHQHGMCTGCKDLIQMHHRELYGNGRAGLTSVVATQGERLESMRDPERVSISAGRKSWAAIIVSVASAVGAALAAAFGR